MEPSKQMYSEAGVEKHMKKYLLKKGDNMEHFKKVQSQNIWVAENQTMKTMQHLSLWKLFNQNYYLFKVIFNCQHLQQCFI